MKFISWNVNGLRACLQKGFMDYVIHDSNSFAHSVRIQLFFNDGQHLSNLPGKPLLPKVPVSAHQGVIHIEQL